MSNGALSSDTPVARLCHIIQWKDFDGYGFNLHAEKGKPGQFIGKVDEGSPAEAAGLKEGDRIIEVNGVNIANENHKQVVQRIKAVPNETKLLVVDSEADKYFKANNITLKSGMSEVKYLKTPVPEADNTNETEEKSDVNDSQIDALPNDNKKSSDAGSSNTTPSTDRKSSSSHQSDQGNDTNAVQEVSPKSPGAESSNSTLERNTVNNSSGINLNMSAKELREKLASRKKYDPKKESMDFKKKFEIVQTL